MKNKLFLTVLMFLFCLSLSAEIHSGTCGDNLTWTLDTESGILTISGTGAMYDYPGWNSPWREYKDDVTSVIVGEGVTTIGYAAFRDHGHLQQCHLPSTITSIGEEAFCFCFQLISIEIPDACTSFGSASFNLVPNVVITDESLLPYKGSARSINGYVEGVFVYADETKRSLRACSSVASGSITLNDAVERIEYMAFAQCEDITNIQFGSHLQYIGEWSLNGCVGLESLAFQEGLIEIASSAFGNCFGLQEIFLPNSLTTVGNFAIGNCPVLHTIHLGESLTTIGAQLFDACPAIEIIYASMATPPVLGDGAFAETTLSDVTCYVPYQSLPLYWQAPVWREMNLQALDAPTPCITASGTCGAEGDNLTWELSCDGVLTISGTGAMKDYPSSTTKPWAEYRTIIKELVVKEGVTSIGDRSFSAGTAHLNEGYKIESLTLPNSLTRIGQFAFFDCTTLASLQIPENVESIGYAAFYGCNLTSVFIPASVTNIEKSAFEDNTFLASMEVENGNLVYDSREDCNAIIETASNILISGCQNSVIPVGIVAIGDAAFRQCSRLTAITFPEGIKTIGPNAFDECSGLTSIELPEGVTTIGEVAFHSCLNVTSVILPNSLTRIGASAFANCRKFTSITIPSKVTVLGNLCFAANDRTLTTVTFEPITPPAMGEQCFNTTYCQFYVPCGTKNTYVKALGVWSGKVFEPQDCTMEPSCPFTGTCGDNLTWTLDCEGVLTISGTGEMYSYTELGTQPWSDHLESVFSIIVKEGVSSIGDRVFAGCISVTTIEIPNSATSIGYGAFYNCRSLTSIEIPNSVTSIGQEAFGNCSNLSSVEIPNGIANIGIEVFYRCYSLTSVKIPNNVTIIEWGAFWGCKSLTSIEIPNSVKQIAWIAFSGCSGLASITCNAIAPPVLGENVFLNVDKSIPLYVPLQSVEAYKAADGWKDFFNILPIEGQEECKYETTDGATVWEDELPYSWESVTFNEAGTETLTLQASDGCDSVVTFTLHVRHHNIVLQENEDAQYYDFFAEDYNGYTVNTAMLNRQFAQGKWATLCLPFDVRKGQMISLGLYGRVFEFRYAEVKENNTLVVYFAVAQSLEAGKGYIVNANAKLAQKTSFVFANVTINTDADNGDIATLTGYNDVSGRGSIWLVGTLRTGTLYNYAGGNTYLGLKDNKLYYPNTTTGTAVRAYRGFFRSGISGVIEEGDDDDEPAAPQRVRIVVEGETVTELEVMNGEADMQDIQPARKFINNGILYIERNGKTYTAQGAEL